MRDVLIEIEELASRLRRQRDVPDRETLRVPSFAIQDILRLLASKAAASVKHIYPVHSEDIRPRSFELAIWRQVARNGLPVERIYAVPHAGFARLAVEAMIADDLAAGIISDNVTLSALPADAPYGSITQQLLIDEQIVIRASDDADSEGRNGDERSWTCAVGDKDVLASATLWSALSDRIVDINSGHRTVNLEEPLVSSADLISGVSSVLCSGDHIDRSDCSWYHGSWQYLRLLDLVSTPTWHDSFYRTSLSALFLSKPNASVLISGTADYSVLAYVMDAAAAANAKPQITVLDQCATPLFACRWYAKQRNMPIDTKQGDILGDLSLMRNCIDAVISDAFLTRFKSDEVSEVIRAWVGVLRDPQSRIITTVRLHSVTTAVRDDEKAVADFVARTQSRLPKWRGFVRKPSREIVGVAETYIRRMVSNRHGEERDIVNLLEKEGLKLVHNEVGDVPGELYPTAYLRLIAAKD